MALGSARVGENALDYLWLLRGDAAGRNRYLLELNVLCSIEFWKNLRDDCLRSGCFFCLLYLVYRPVASGLSAWWLGAMRAMRWALLLRITCEGCAFIGVYESSYFGFILVAEVFPVDECQTGDSYWAAPSKIP